MIGIYTFKAGKGLTAENEAYLVAGAIAFWIMSFFKKSYETALEGFHYSLKTNICHGIVANSLNIRNCIYFCQKSENFTACCYHGNTLLNLYNRNRPPLRF